MPYLHSGWLRASVEESDPANANLGSASILTSREVEILQWVEQGKSNNEIAQILSISHLTVKNHVQKILRRLNVQNRAQAVAKGIALNLTGRYADDGAERCVRGWRAKQRGASEPRPRFPRSAAPSPPLVGISIDTFARSFPISTSVTVSLSFDTQRFSHDTHRSPGSVTLPLWTKGACHDR